MRRYLLVAIFMIGIIVICAEAAVYVHSRLFFLFGYDPSQVGTVCPGASEASPSGSPAITPRNDCTPSFTDQDVRDYVGTLHGVNKIGYVGQPTITHIWFISSDDAAALTDEPASNLGAPVVCYVALSGTFTGDAPPVASRGSDGSTRPELHHGTLIFDAHTGNLLEAGAGP